MMIKIALLLSFLAVAAFRQVQCERLVWSDEFDTLDEKKWHHLVSGWDGGNGQFQYNRNNRKNSFTRDGKLFIRPTQTVEEIPDLQKGMISDKKCNMEPCAVYGGSDIIYPFFSARISTVDSFSVKYGRIEISAKMPTGDWIWPSIFMNSTDGVYGAWPRSGEIDIVNLRSNPDLKSPDGVNHGNVEFESTLRFGPNWRGGPAYYTIGKNVQAAPGKSWSDGFHKYEFIWRPDVMKFFVDGQLINEVKIPAGGFTELGKMTCDLYKGKAKNAPFDQRFHFIINVAVGGENFFPAAWKSAGQARPWKGGDNRRQFWNSRTSWLKSWGTPDQHSLQIDYVRVYQD